MCDDCLHRSYRETARLIRARAVDWDRVDDTIEELSRVVGEYPNLMALAAKLIRYQSKERLAELEDAGDRYGDDE